MKKWLAIAFCGLLALSLIACTANTDNNQNSSQDESGTDQQESADNGAGSDSGGNSADGDSADGDSTGGEEQDTEIANPFTDYATLEEAAQAAGVTFAEPEGLPEGYTFSAARAMEGEMLEAVYADENGNELTIRKAVGTEDCSGDYNTYEETTVLTVDTVEVTCSGADGVIRLAVWNDGTNAYAISCGAGLDEAAVTALVSGIMA